MRLIRLCARGRCTVEFMPKRPWQLARWNVRIVTRLEGTGEKMQLHLVLMYLR
jgi:hypothetical protein